MDISIQIITLAAWSYVRTPLRNSVPAGVRAWFPNQRRVPHISLVFREMWDTTFPLTLDSSDTSRRSASVVSHISRKTSEIWGTRRWLGNEISGRVL
jgi:hypothetical protein